MPEMLRPDQVTTVAVPAAAQPVAPAQQQPAAPAQPIEPFRRKPGPPLLLIPHIMDKAPVQQARAGQPVRMSSKKNSYTIQSLLAALHANPNDAGTRGVLADAMDDEGREHEAKALRSPDPIHVWEIYGEDPELRIKRGDAGEPPPPHSSEWRRQPTGMWIDADTREGARLALIYALRSRTPIHISMGDPESGRDMLEEHDNHGELYVPNPWYGEAPLPPGRGTLLISNPRSHLGFPVYGSRIVRIRTYSPGTRGHGQVLWKHPTYHHGEIEIRPYTPSEDPARYPEPTFEVAVDGRPHAGFHSELAARRWVAKMGLSPETARPAHEKLARSGTPIKLTNPDELKALAPADGGPDHYDVGRWGVLADYLADHEDPRERLIRASLAYSLDDNDWDKFRRHVPWHVSWGAPNNQGWFHQQVVDTEDGHVKFQPHMDGRVHVEARFHVPDRRPEVSPTAIQESVPFWEIMPGHEAASLLETLVRQKKVLGPLSLNGRKSADWGNIEPYANWLKNWIGNGEMPRINRVLFGRDGTPVRMARSDILPLYHRAWENVKDSAPWGILADVLDEEGKAHTARFVREMSGHELSPGVSFNRVEHGQYGAFPVIYGAFGGMRMSIYPILDADHYSEVANSKQMPTKTPTWAVRFHRPGEPLREFASHPIIGYVGDEQGRGILHEIETDEFDHPDVAQRRGEFPDSPHYYARLSDAKAHFSLPNFQPPTRLRRAVRAARQAVKMSSTKILTGLYEGIKRNPRDRGAWGVFADAADEAGYSAMAYAARRVAMEGQDDPGYRPWLGAKPPEIHEPVHRDGHVFVWGWSGGVPIIPQTGPEFSGIRFGYYHRDGQSPVIHVPPEVAITAFHELDKEDAGVIHDYDLDAVREMFPRPPHRFSAAQAPPGGMIVRGIMYPGGQMVPEEALEAHPAPTAAPPRAPKGGGRLRKRIRQAAGKDRMQRSGLPVRFGIADNRAIGRHIINNPQDQGAWAALSDSLREGGLDGWADLTAHIGAHGQPTDWTYIPGSKREYIHPDVAAKGVKVGYVAGAPIMEGHLQGLMARIRVIDHTGFGGLPNPQRSALTGYSDESDLPPLPMIDVAMGTDSELYDAIAHAVLPAYHPMAKKLMHELHQANPDYAEGSGVGGAPHYIPRDKRKWSGVRSILSRANKPIRLSRPPIQGVL